MEPKKAKEAKAPSRKLRQGLVNDHLLRIADSLPVLIAYVDSQERYLFNNKTFEEWFGVSRENLKGKPISENMGPAYSKIKKFVNQVLLGKKVGFEVSLTNKEGESRSIYSQYIPDLEGPGKVRGFFVLAQDITEQKRNEARVRKEGEQILSIFDGIDEAIYVIDPQTYEVLYVNRAKKSEFSKELVGQKCFQALQGLEKPCDFCPNDRIFGKNLGKTYTWEWQNLKNKRWYRCHDKAIRWPDGRWVRYEMALDISDRKQGEEKIANLQRRLEALWKIAHLVEEEPEALFQTIINQAVVLTDSAHGFWGFLSKDEIEMTSIIWSDKTLEGCRMSKFGNEIPSPMADLWKEPIRLKKPVIINDYQSKPPGKKGLPPGHVPITRLVMVPFLMKERIVLLVGMANKASDYTEEDVQQLHAFVTNALLVMEKKKTEQDLGKAEEKYRSIFENAIEGLFRSSPEGPFLAVNPAMARIFGYDSPEALIRSLRDIEHQIYIDPDRLNELRRLLKSKGKAEGFEFQAIRQDGQVIWVSINIRAVRDEQGKLQFFEGSTLDITEKKNMQAERIQADRLSTIGELAAGVAHEINNPITGIINYAQILLDQTKDREQGGEIPKRIIKEGERIASIVDNLLMFAKDRGEQKQPAPLFSLLNSVFDLIGTQIKKDGILVMIEVPPDLPPIVVKSQQIHQVFLNLISNARYALNRKYPGRHNKKILEIRGIRKSDSNGPPWVEVSFYDHGIGIPPVQIDRVCDPFFTTKPPGEGTGLGLSISRSIIQDHGGRLGFESKEGEYTRAIVELPAVE